MLQTCFNGNAELLVIFIYMSNMYFVGIFYFYFMRDSSEMQKYKYHLEI